MGWMTEPLRELPSSALPDTGNAFMNRQFLALLTDSGSRTRDTGWEPWHYRHDSGALLPAYRKYHSWGEYVFDWAWADAYARAGVDYYPKLLTAVPYTPSVGPRLFGEASAQLWQEWQEQLPDTCARAGVSGWHILFPTEATMAYFPEPEYIVRKGCQFHWHNPGYRDFDDFLARMTARRRKTVRKERRRVADQGITLRRVTGREMRADWLHDFYLFYHTTYLKRGQTGYLSDAFFEGVVEQLPDNVMFALAFRGEQLVAGALFFHDAYTLYGRYWGAREEIDCLHFEACYYQGIEFALERGLRRFDPGTQGEHKIPRGFEPVATWSAHWLAHREFHALVADHMAPEKDHIDAYMAEARTLLPFRQDEHPTT